MPANTEGQRLYSEWIGNLRRHWIGREVRYEGRQHKVVDVDYNGLLLIDRPTAWNDTTAVMAWQLDDYISHIS